MNKITMGSVFSGIGGEMVAATMIGWEVDFFCEKNDFCNKVLSFWYPYAKNYEDITKTNFGEWHGKVDVLTGGFPCQPFSYAGKRRGAEDDRYLWPHMFRCIDEVQPTWVVAENVAGILTMVEQGEVVKVGGQTSLFAEDNAVQRYELRETFTLQRICTDLESHGYAVQPVLVPACAVGAPHRRDRVFIVARRVASDTDNGADRRTAREDESKGGEERIQERHEVRKPDEPNQVRPEGAHDVIADTTNMGRSRRWSEESEQGRQDGHSVGILSDVEGFGESRTSPHPDSHRGSEVDEHMESELANGASIECFGCERTSADTSSKRPQAGHRGRETGETSRNASSGNARSDSEFSDIAGIGRWLGFPTVSPIHRGNDGLPFDVDRLTLSIGKWRTESLKAYGNAIVPQVLYEIFRAIEIAEHERR